MYKHIHIHIRRSVMNLWNSWKTWIVIEQEELSDPHCNLFHYTNNVSNQVTIDFGVYKISDSSLN